MADRDLALHGVFVDASCGGIRVQYLLELDQQLLGMVAVVVLAGSHVGFADARLVLAVVGHVLFFRHLQCPDKRGEAKPGIALVFPKSLDGRHLDGVAYVAVNYIRRESLDEDAFQGVVGVACEHERGEYVLQNRAVDAAHLTMLRERVCGRVGGLLGILDRILLLNVFRIVIGCQDDFESDPIGPRRDLLQFLGAARSFA